MTLKTGSHSGFFFEAAGPSLLPGKPDKTTGYTTHSLFRAKAGSILPAARPRKRLVKVYDDATAENLSVVLRRPGASGSDEGKLLNLEGLFS